MILLIGLAIGHSVGYVRAKKASFPQIEQVNDINEGISTIKFLEVKNNILYGQIDGQKVRIAYSPEYIYDLKIGDTFEIPLREINLQAYYGAQNIPEGMSYIASKNGKYFYHIFDPRALRLTPKNRKYFKTEGEAIKAGYIAKK